jgi:3-oxoacyl-ACP reductase-like protein
VGLSTAPGDGGVRGERDRYHEADASVGAAVDAIDDGQIVSVTGDAGVAVALPDARACVYSASLGEGDLTAAMAVVFPLARPTRTPSRRGRTESVQRSSRR